MGSPVLCFRWPSALPRAHPLFQPMYSIAQAILCAQGGRRYNQNMRALHGSDAKCMTTLALCVRVLTLITLPISVSEVAPATGALNGGGGGRGVGGGAGMLHFTCEQRRDPFTYCALALLWHGSPSAHRRHPA